MINELIDQIGGRERLVDTANEDIQFLESVRQRRGKLFDLEEEKLALIRIALSALTATPPAAIAPDGWKLVPIEATPDMLDASWKIHSIYHPSAYRTMVAAAPAPAGDGG